MCNVALVEIWLPTSSGHSSFVLRGPSLPKSLNSPSSVSCRSIVLSILAHTNTLFSTRKKIYKYINLKNIYI